MRVLAALFVLLPLLAAPAAAHGPEPGAHKRGEHGLPHDPQDDILKSIGVDERLGARVPTDLALIDPSGRTVRLGDYLRGGPALLTLNYFTCPMLCPMNFRNLSSTINEVRNISLSKDYRVITVSINPEERPENVRARADESHRFLPGLADADDRWPFLRGSPEAIQRLTETVGFRYKKVGDEYAHPNVTIVLTPEGAISRYLYGVEIPPLDLRLALLESAGGKIGASSAADTILMYCFHYDPVGKKYALVARNIMKGAGAVTLLFLAALLGWLRFRHGRSVPGR